MSLSQVGVTFQVAEHEFEERDNSHMDGKEVFTFSHLHVITTLSSRITLLNCYDRCLLILDISRLEQRLLSENHKSHVAVLVP